MDLLLHSTKHEKFLFILVSQLVTNSEVLLDSPDEVRRVRSGPTERSPVKPHDKYDLFLFMDMWKGFISGQTSNPSWA